MFFYHLTEIHLKTNASQAGKVGLTGAVATVAPASPPIIFTEEHNFELNLLGPLKIPRAIVSNLAAWAIRRSEERRVAHAVTHGL